MSTDRIDTTAGPDPSDLPLFATLPAQRPGRVRGSFSINPTPTPVAAAAAPHGNGGGNGNDNGEAVAIDSHRKRIRNFVLTGDSTVVFASIGTSFVPEEP